jgi:hypothetical protein
MYNQAKLTKLLSEMSGYDTLSFGEGWGEATNWQPDFSWQVPSEPYLSMAEGGGEASEWHSNKA